MSGEMMTQDLTEGIKHPLSFLRSVEQNRETEDE